jgi:hypothetical protein
MVIRGVSLLYAKRVPTGSKTSFLHMKQRLTDY